MSAPIVIWTNVVFDGAAASARRMLADSLRGHTLHVVNGGVPAEEARKLLDEAAVAFGQPPPDALLASRSLRWVELNSAGYEKYDRPDVRDALAARHIVLTNASGVYADACAQHTLAMMLAAARGLPAALDAQRERRWTWNELRPRMRRLEGDTVLILGWGSIARRLVELLAPFGVRVTALRRRPAGNEPVAIVTADRLDDALARTTHLVNLLPGGAQTAGFVNGARLAKLPRGAFLYNVGRGTTVDQPALIEALESGQLAAAWLDVTDPEPLPADHPLWRTRNCCITPHLAGGHADEAGHQVRHFLDNFSRFTSGGTLNDRVW
jgi:phosphoglycerate dehydrogenase-like enzyme